MHFPLTEQWFRNDLDEGQWIFWSLDILMYLIVALILWGVWSLIEDWTANWYEWDAVIVDKFHTSESTSTGTGIGMVGGHAAVVSTSNHTPEQWYVMVRDEEDKSIHKVYCDDDFFYNHKVGDKIIYTGKISRFRNVLVSDLYAVEPEKPFTK